MLSLERNSVIVAILQYSANLVLDLSYLSRTRQLKYVYYSKSKIAGSDIVQILIVYFCKGLFVYRDRNIGQLHDDVILIQLRECFLMQIKAIVL